MMETMLGIKREMIKKNRITIQFDSIFNNMYLPTCYQLGKYSRLQGNSTFILLSGRLKKQLNYVQNRCTVCLARNLRFKKKLFIRIGA